MNLNTPFPDIPASNMPMAFPSGRSRLPQRGCVLAADVGGTKTNLALFEIQNQSLRILRNGNFPTTDHESLLKALTDFKDSSAISVDAICLGVAGAVKDNVVKGTNFLWEIDGNRLQKNLSAKRLTVINDLEANAYGLIALDNSDYKTVLPGVVQKGNAGLISPGTGLGEAGMYWNGNAFHPFASEGGHCTFSPVDKMDAALWEELYDKFGHVSWERIVSGQGIENIYRFLRKFRKKEEPQWLTEAMESVDQAIVITKTAQAKKDAICEETLHLFVKYLAREAAQVALKMKATSGIFIGGGIAPKIIDLIDSQYFYHHFTNLGRMESLLKDIPVKIVLNDKTALVGAAYFAAMNI